jgi:hypothetical protein
MKKINKEYLIGNKAIAILGEGDSGKTNLAVYLAKLTEKKKFLLGYPKDMKEFTKLNSTRDFNLIPENSVLVIDEFSKYFPMWEKRSNESLMELLQFAEHNKIKLILTTQLSQFITKQCEGFIPCWAIKQLNLRRLKNGSTPSYALKYVIKHPNISRDFIKIKTNEFIWYNDQGVLGENGVYEFPFMNVKKDWGRNNDKNADKNTELNLIKTPTKIIEENKKTIK